MKKLSIILVLVVGFGVGVWGATGDWQSRTTGIWKDYTSWQIDKGSGFVDALVGDGYPTTSFTTTVTIRNGHTITETSTIRGVGGAAVLTIDAGGTLNTSGLIRGDQGASSLLLAQLNINGNLTTSNYVNADIFNMGPDGVFTTSFNGSAGWWNSTYAPSSVSLNATSTVNYSGPIHKIGAVTYGNLIISGAGSQELVGPITVNGNLTIGPSSNLDLYAKNLTINGSSFILNGTLSDTYTGSGSSIKLLNEFSSISGSGTFGTGLYELNIGADYWSLPCYFTLSNTNEFSVEYLNVAGSATLNPGAKLTISSNATLANESPALVLLSDGSSTASLITSAALSNDEGGQVAKMQRYMLGSRWHLISSPLPGEAISSFLTNLPANSGINTNGSLRSMTEYDATATTPGWQPYFTNSESGTLSTGKGFLMGMTSSGTVEFTGTPITTSPNVTVTTAGSAKNCVGNPYTSSLAISVDASTSTNFLTANDLALDASYRGLYVWDEQPGYTAVAKTRDDYVFITAAAGAGPDYLQPGQAFLVKAASTSLSFSTDMRSHQNEDPVPTFYKKSSSDLSVSEIKLRAYDTAYEAKTTIRFLENMTLGLDPGYDGGLIGGLEKFTLYTDLIESNGVNFMVQCLPNDDFSSLSVPIGFNYSNGDLVTFQAEVSSLPEDCKVILEDRELEVFTDLSTPGSKYLVNLPNNIAGTGRFFLHTFNPQTVNTDMDDLQNITIFAFDKEIIVQGEIAERSSVKLYDLSGRMVLQTVLNDNYRNSISASELKEGVYIVHLQVGDKVKTSKLFLK